MRTLPLALLVLLLSAAPVRAQGLLHELVSPNEQEGGYFGAAVSGVPDLDGDRAGDLLVGAFLEEYGGSPFSAGRAYAFSGATGALIHTLTSPNPETSGFFGTAVAGVPDLDGDGRGDLIVGAGESGGAPDAGRVYVFSGATGALIHTLTSPSPEENGSFGNAVAGVEDVDGDGAGDVVVGARIESPGSSPDLAGRAYVFSGATGALLYTLASPNEEASGLFGTAVAGVEDADGDGRGDLLVGAMWEDPGSSPSGAGRAYVFSGASGELLHALASPNEEAGGEFGGAVAGVGDVDGDGRGDLLVGAMWEHPAGHATGRAYVFSGATGALIHTLTSPHAPGLAFFGNAVAGVADLDGDGAGDLLVGAFDESPGDSPDLAGRAYVFSGATGALLYELASPNEEERGLFGYAVSGVPDADGDGRGDLLVGSRQESPGDSPIGAGRAYLFSGAGKGTAVEGGAPAAPFVLHAPRPNPLAAHTVLPFTLAVPSAVRLVVYDLLGREVAVLVDETRGAGRHEAMLDASGLPAGVYLARLTAGGLTATRRVVVAR